MIHYPVKKFPNTACKTLVRIEPNGIRIYKDKKKYKDVHEAINQAKIINNKLNQSHKVSHYFCKTCRYWHIGRTYEMLKNNLKIELT